MDGDTVEFHQGDGPEDVRLIGVDAPEAAGRMDRPQPLPREAARFFEKRLEGRRATLRRRTTLRFDIERTDGYGRFLAQAYPRGVRMFNGDLVERGHVQAATFPPNVRHGERFEAGQAEARAAWNLGPPAGRPMPPDGSGQRPWGRLLKLGGGFGRARGFVAFR